MVPAHTAGYPVFVDGFQEKNKDRLRTVVRMNSDGGDIARVAVDETVDDEFPTNEA